MSKIQLKNVRLSFPSLFQKGTYEGKENNKYEATFLIPKKDSETKKMVDEAIEKAIIDYGKKIKISKDRYCIKDGDDSELDGYENNWSLKAGNKRRPIAIGRDKASLTEEDNLLYAGCYVNAVVDFWIQDNSYGKRVNANLHGVQFVKHGDAFGSPVEDVTEVFDDLDDL